MKLLFVLTLSLSFSLSALESDCTENCQTEKPLVVQKAPSQHTDQELEKSFETTEETLNKISRDIAGSIVEEE